MRLTPCGDIRVDAPPSQARPQRVAIVTAIRNQAVGPLAGTSRLPRPLDGYRVEGLLEGVTSAGDAAPRYTPNRVAVPSTSTLHWVPLPRFVFPTLSPLLPGNETAIRKALLPAQFFLVVEWAQEGLPELEQDAALFPVLEPAPAGTRAATSPRQLAPLGTGPEDPEGALQTALICDTRASTLW